MATKKQLALNAARQDIQTMLSRQSILNGGSLDAKRPCSWESYGYKEHLCFHDFYRLWERQGIAHGLVKRWTDKCWQSHPEVIEGYPEDRAEQITAWERTFNALAKRITLWPRMKEADKRRMVGKYAALVIRVRDGKSWDKPVGRISASQIEELIPAWEGQLLPTRFDEFGRATQWQFRERTQDSERFTEIHPDRILILGDPVEGVPFLRAAFNDFVNIEKILGGSGESFLKNASRQLAINFDKEAQLEQIARAHGIPMSEIQALFDDISRGMNAGVDQTIVTQAATVTPLVASVPMPREHFEIALESIAASTNTPIKIIVGMQTGERASTEDIKDFNTGAMGRRHDVNTPEIESFVQWCFRHGALEPIEYSVLWSDLNEKSLSERLDSADKMATVNQKLLAMGQPVFKADEIREVAGYAALDEQLALDEQVEESRD